MVVTINNYNKFEFYIGSSSEYNWDYIIVGKLDKDEIEVITDYSGYKVQFKLVELYENIKQKFKAES